MNRSIWESKVELSVSTSIWIWFLTRLRKSTSKRQLESIWVIRTWLENFLVFTSYSIFKFTLRSHLTKGWQHHFNTASTREGKCRQVVISQKILRLKIHIYAIVFVLYFFVHYRCTWIKRKEENAKYFENFFSFIYFSTS